MPLEPLTFVGEQDHPDIRSATDLWQATPLPGWFQLAGGDPPHQHFTRGMGGLYPARPSGTQHE